jgi:uncharacterized delta-60 repeat protein
VLAGGIAVPCKSPSSYALGIFSALVIVFTAAAAAASPGDFDTTFAGDGIVDEPAATTGYAVAIQSDGKILVAAGEQFAVFRYDASGNLDPSFGTAGRASASFGGLDESARAVTVAPDGKILVAGQMRTGSSVIELAIARFDASGTLDPTFGTGGLTSTDVPGSGFTHSMVRLPSGRIVLASNSDLNNGLLVAYDDDGNLDAGFGTGGMVAVAGNTISALAVAGDAIVAAGAVGTTFGDGAIVARFGFDGTAGPIATILGDGSGRAITIDPLGRSVVAGSTNDCMDTFVARVFADGTLDPTFGMDGVATIDIAPVQANLCAEIGSAVALQPDGKILVATYSQAADAPPSPLVLLDWHLSRLDADGALDLGFDDTHAPADGHAFIDDARVDAIAMQADGKVVTVGRFARPNYDNAPMVFFDESLLVTRNEAMATPLCTTAPRNDCDAAAPRASTLKLKSATATKKPQLSWCFKKGSATAADFGDPTTGGSYALCLYDATNALVGMTQVEGDGTCGTKPCWKATGSAGWSYADKRGTSWGVGKLKIKTGTGKASICVQGKHANLPAVALPATLPLRAQFQTSTGSCFDATYVAAAKNDASGLTTKN